MRYMMLPTGCQLRTATRGDIRALEDLIALSARQLAANHYSTAQIDGALRGAWGVDTQLIEDRTYVVVERAGQLIGCGGWSRRRTLFGGDAQAERDSGELDANAEAARIRAFFVHPAFARRGIGTAILDHCEKEAMAHGYARIELMATLPGTGFYAARGYISHVSVQWPLGDGLHIEFVPMAKPALSRCSSGQQGE
jgi:N-acetylglutamate synthase-like GNAT family acetyltransferase